jgi:hypothetical protein
MIKSDAVATNSGCARTARLRRGSGDVKVGLQRATYDLAGVGVVSFGLRFDRSTQVGIEADRNYFAWR